MKNLQKIWGLACSWSAFGNFHGVTSVSSVQTYLLFNLVVNISIIMICIKKCKQINIL